MTEVRLQRLLARAGLASRRTAEEMIRNGRVRVNGEVACVGAVVDPAVDVVSVGGRRVRLHADVWIALHKPVGYIVSKKDTGGRHTVFELVPDVPGLTYVGRLHLMTSGLLLLTNDGQCANRLTHPRYGVEKGYRVLVRGQPRSVVERELRAPIELDKRPVRIARAQTRQLSGNRTEIDLVVTEGRHRIVRRICEELGLEVEQLVRTSHGPVRLGRLPVGRWRYLNERERNAVLAAA